MLAVIVSPLLLDTKIWASTSVSGAVRLVGTRPPILSCCKARWRLIPSRVMPRTSPELIAPGECVQPLQQLLVADEIGGDHAIPSRAPATPCGDTGDQDPAMGATLRYC